MTINLQHYKQCNYKIPQDLKVWYGDDWIADQLYKHGYKIATYRNALAIHVIGTSSGSEKIKAVIARDGDIVKKYQIDFENVVHTKKRLKWYK